MANRGNMFAALADDRSGSRSSRKSKKSTPAAAAVQVPTAPAVDVSAHLRQVADGLSIPVEVAQQASEKMWKDGVPGFDKAEQIMEFILEGGLDTPAGASPAPAAPHEQDSPAVGPTTPPAATVTHAANGHAEASSSGEVEGIRGKLIDFITAREAPVSAILRDLNAWLSVSRSHGRDLNPVFGDVLTALFQRLLDAFPIDDAVSATLAETVWLLLAPTPVDLDCDALPAAVQSTSDAAVGIVCQRVACVGVFLSKLRDAEAESGSTHVTIVMNETARVLAAAMGQYRAALVTSARTLATLASIDAALSGMGEEVLKLPSTPPSAPAPDAPAPSMRALLHTRDTAEAHARTTCARLNACAALVRVEESGAATRLDRDSGVDLSPLYMALTELTSAADTSMDARGRAGRAPSRSTAEAINAAAVRSRAALEALKHEIEGSIAPVQAARAEVHARAQELLQRRAALVEELAQVDALLTECSDHAAALSHKLDEAMARHRPRMSAAETEYRDAEARLATLHAQDTLVGEMRALISDMNALAASSLTAAASSTFPGSTRTASAAPSAQGGSAAVAAERDTRTACLTSTLRYMTAEERLLHALSSRAARARARAEVCDAEVVRFNGFNLARNAQSYAQKAAVARNEAAEDDGSVAALRAAATARLEEVQATVATTHVTPKEMGMLHRIRAAAVRCGLPPHVSKDWRLPHNSDPDASTYASALVETPLPLDMVDREPVVVAAAPAAPAPAPDVDPKRAAPAQRKAAQRPAAVATPPRAAANKDVVALPSPKTPAMTAASTASASASPGPRNGGWAAAVSRKSHA